MDLLLDVQLQLSRVVSSLTQSAQSFATSDSTSTTVMTPVLIHIEELLDEIRVATRAIISENSAIKSTALPSTHTSTRRTEFEDFRIKLESEDIVDYASETETEDEEKDEREEGSPKSVEIRDETGEKRSRETRDDEDEPQHKHEDVPLESEKEAQLRRSIVNLVECISECSHVSTDASSKIIWSAVTRVTQASTHSIKQMLKNTRDGSIPSVKLAERFSDAMVQLPDIITRHHGRKKVNPNWIIATSDNLKHLCSYAKKNSMWPSCLSDLPFESTPEAIRGLLGVAALESLSKMEHFIERVTKGGQLRADQMEKPVGKLASLLRLDFKSAKSREKNSKRTEEDWGRFAAIGKTLAEWIYKSQKATKPPKTQKHLLRFDLQLRGFAKKNPDRVPPILLEYVYMECPHC